MTTTERFATIALLVGLLAGVLSGCDDDPEPQGRPASDQPTDVTDAGEPTDPWSDAARPGASVELDVAVDDYRLLVDYSVTNHSADDLLVLNRLPRPAGAGTSYVDDIAYVTGQDGGRVQVAQRVFPWPDSDRVNHAQAPQMGATGLPRARRSPHTSRSRCRWSGGSRSATTSATARSPCPTRCATWCSAWA